MIDIDVKELERSIEKTRQQALIAIIVGSISLVVGLVLGPILRIFVL